MEDNKNNIFYNANEAIYDQLETVNKENTENEIESEIENEVPPYNDTREVDQDEEDKDTSDLNRIKNQTTMDNSFGEERSKCSDSNTIESNKNDKYHDKVKH